MNHTGVNNSFVVLQKWPFVVNTGQNQSGQ